MALLKTAEKGDTKMKTEMIDKKFPDTKRKLVKNREKRIGKTGQDIQKIETSVFLLFKTHPH